MAASLPNEQHCQTLWQQETQIKPEIEGWCIFIDRRKGNCLACHNIDVENWPEDLPTPGNTAPILEKITQKYSDRVDLKGLIVDPSVINSTTFMPLFGKHEILSNDEIDLVVKYLMTQ